MKASRCITAFAARSLAVLTVSTLLVQCSMPPEQAWRYIQTNGLFPYLSTVSQPSPPFRTGGSSYSQRYDYQRTSPYSMRSPNTPYRSYYGAANRSGYAANRYFSAPSSGNDSSRYVPRIRSSPSSHERSPRVRMPVEEPASTPHISHSEPAPTAFPKTSGSTSPIAPPPSNAATDNLPYGTAVPGRLNMVNSPFAGKTQLVDVSGMSAGQTVKCPYTGKLFKVPPTQQAANHAEPRHESKVETSQPSDEPKDGDKKP